MRDTDNNYETRLMLLETQIAHQQAQSEKVFDKMDKLTDSLQEMCVSFRESAIKHDNLKESNARLWKETEENTKDIINLKETNAGNKFVLDTLKNSINRGIVAIVLSMVGSISTVTYYAIDIKETPKQEQTP